MLIQDHDFLHASIIQFHGLSDTN